MAEPTAYDLPKLTYDGKLRRHGMEIGHLYERLPGVNLARSAVGRAVNDDRAVPLEFLHVSKNWLTTVRTRLTYAQL